MKTAYRKIFPYTLFLTLLFSFQSYSIPAYSNEKLYEIGQQQLLLYWDTLTPTEQQELSKQIDCLDNSVFKQQQKVISEKDVAHPGLLTPFLDFSHSGSTQDFERGKKLIAEGKVGCLIVAGGQGTRLQCNGPKGVFPVTIVKQKSLFQLFAERVRAAGNQSKHKLPMAIMTSPANHHETAAFFQKNDFFGLDPDQVAFFSQEELPFLNAKGDLFLESPSRIASGPDGNAPSLKHFVKSGIWSDWVSQGVRYLIYVHIDNPLADPFDSELIGFHERQGSDLVMKCIERKDPLEKLGVILNKDGIVQVIEYSEITPAERDACNEDGSLKHRCGNISIFSFSMDFIHDIATLYYDQLPFHKAWKAAKYLASDGTTKMADKAIAWKFEKFIFDVLPFAGKITALLYPRKECFAPLKNATGSDSVDDVKAALQRYDVQVFEKITGITPPDRPFELDPQFYYPTEEMLNKWKGESLPETPYVESGL